MQNPIKEIYKWQEKAGNLNKPYDDFLESSFQIEEALEGFENILGNFSAKDMSRQILEEGEFEGSDVDRLDKACDAIIFAIGSMAKLGLSPQDIQQALLIVNQANMQKLGMPRDTKGKLMKPPGFVGPEPKLQALLDKRVQS